MAANVFMTGFPGFIARRLVDRLVVRDPKAHFTFLIQERFRDLAESDIATLDATHPGFAKRATLVAGDITEPNLGMPPEVYARETARAHRVWHLAAIYDLHVSPAVAYRVNVVGTANVLDFAQDCAKLERVDHVSTCHVSGERTGHVFEGELDEGQGFKNHYESTKCWSELEVRRRMQRGLPAAIHRPAIVVGDSRTGDTDKYDGPYFVIQLLLKLPDWLPMLNVGHGEARVNLAPVDFLVDAMAEVGTRPEAIGKTFHLADPNPHSSREIMARMLEVLGRSKPLADLPSIVVERALDVAALRKLAQLPKEIIVYFNHEVEYDTSNLVGLLEGTGIACPDLLETLPTMVDYVKQHPDKPFLDGRTVA